ncbi:hypothetical protein GE09DRAFT_1213641 [Coniochaeta sp. 2T2.1]|nr:hypothetical protein GE09DRAFT_1213641 [Coniochaeta sp. 2T2.1]
MAPYGQFLYASYSSFEEDFVGRPLSCNRTNPDNNTGILTKEPILWVSWSWNTTLLATPVDVTQWNTTLYYQGKMEVNNYTVRQDKLLLPGRRG